MDNNRRREIVEEELSKMIKKTWPEITKFSEKHDEDTTISLVLSLAGTIIGRMAIKYKIPRDKFLHIMASFTKDIIMDHGFGDKETGIADFIIGKYINYYEENEPQAILFKFKRDKLDKIYREFLFNSFEELADNQEVSMELMMSLLNKAQNELNSFWQKELKEI